MQQHFPALLTSSSGTTNTVHGIAPPHDITPLSPTLQAFSVNQDFLDKHRCSIHLSLKNVYTDDDFLVSYVTDRPPPTSEVRLTPQSENAMPPTTPVPSSDAPSSGTLGSTI
ncbi:hypothetical protein J6590_091250 [Homalodisca vitripennis]|nr:hypothetical protein J6590_091250 [Homalodisca vitripennis]